MPGLVFFVCFLLFLEKYIFLLIKFELTVSCFLALNSSLFFSRLHSNNLYCDCHLAWLSDWLRQRPRVGLYTQCMGPSHLRGHNVAEVQKREFVCSGKISGVVRFFFFSVTLWCNRCEEFRFQRFRFALQGVIMPSSPQRLCCAERRTLDSRTFVPRTIVYYSDRNIFPVACQGNIGNSQL